MAVNTYRDGPGQVINQFWRFELARSKSSDRWLKEHFDDVWVKKSQEDGYRSRASYKLIELDKKDRLFRAGQLVVDLGAAPGGWSQVAAEKVGDQGVIIASDILPMDPIAGVDFVQGDFTEDEVFEELLALLGDRRADVVISDMAPNMSGMAAVDIPNAMGRWSWLWIWRNGYCDPVACLLPRCFRAKVLMRCWRICEAALTRLSVVSRILRGLVPGRFTRFAKALKAESGQT